MSDKSYISIEERLQALETKITELENNAAYQKFETSTDLSQSFTNQNRPGLKFYFVNKNAVGVSGQINNDGIVECYKSNSGNFGYQKFTALNGDVYIRSYANTWSDWKKITS